MGKFFKGVFKDIFAQFMKETIAIFGNAFLEYYEEDNGWCARHGQTLLKYINSR